MRIVFINAECGRGGGPATIVKDIYKIAIQRDHNCIVAYGRQASDDMERYRIGNRYDLYQHLAKTRLFDLHGLGSYKATIKFVEYLKEYKPDLINLHNIHGYYLNFKVLFEYIKKENVPIVWTLHDCWPFTGHCAYFDKVGCEKWKTECHSCEQVRSYPKSLFKDKSNYNYRLKREIFSSVEKAVVVAPSKWLADIAQQSFLGKYDIQVINNGIDLDVFKPMDNEKSEKRIVLAVASTWDKRKGLEDIISVANKLDKNYQVIIVGLNKSQMKELPKEVIGIERTNTISKLVQLYSMADVFVNASIEDNFPTVILEALACGTPVVTYDTGGCSEQINSDCGYLVSQNDIAGLVRGIYEMSQRDCYMACVKQAKRFDKNVKYMDYIDLFERIVHDGEI